MAARMYDGITKTDYGEDNCLYGLQYMDVAPIYDGEGDGDTTGSAMDGLKYMGGV